MSKEYGRIRDFNPGGENFWGVISKFYRENNHNQISAFLFVIG